MESKKFFFFVAHMLHDANSLYLVDRYPGQNKIHGSVYQSGGTF